MRDWPKAATSIAPNTDRTVRGGGRVGQRTGETKHELQLAGGFFHTGRRPIWRLPGHRSRSGPEKFDKPGTSGGGWEYNLTDTESQNGNSTLLAFLMSLDLLQS